MEPFAPDVGVHLVQRRTAAEASLLIAYASDHPNLLQRGHVRSVGAQRGMRLQPQLALLARSPPYSIVLMVFLHDTIWLLVVS